MSTKPNEATSHKILAESRRGMLWLLFSAILVIPKFLAVRRRPRQRRMLQIALALPGMALATAGAIRHWGAGAETLGVALVLLALAIRPERQKLSVDERVGALGALVALDGGFLYTGDVAGAAVRLLVGAEKLWFLDANLRVRMELPTSQLKILRSASPDGEWTVSFTGGAKEARSVYRGRFAEHFAQVAESTVRNQVRRELPIIP